jgi:hypothetical protein
MKRSDRLKDCETTVTIDLARFPREYWTGSQNPFLKVDEHQLNDIESWIKSMVPASDEYCVELIGRCPGPVSLYIGALLRDMNCQKLTCINPGRGTFTVWDYTGAGE